MNWKPVFLILGAFVLSTTLPVAGLTIGTRLWRAGGAWAGGEPAMGRMAPPFETIASQAVRVPVEARDADGLVYEGIDGGIFTRVSVTPARPLAGKVQLHVQPVAAVDGTALTDAVVDVFAGLDGDWRVRSPALNNPPERTSYTANLELDEPGDWTILVQVRSGTGTGQTRMEVDILPRARSGGNLAVATFAYIGALVAVVGGVLWLARSSRRARARATN